MSWTQAEPTMDARMRTAIEGLLLATQDVTGDYPAHLVDAINEVANAYVRPREAPAIAEALRRLDDLVDHHMKALSSETEGFGYAQLPPARRRWGLTFPYTGMALGNLTLRRALWECVRSVLAGRGLPQIDHPGYWR